MLISQIARQIIIHFYKESEGKSKYWIWRKKDIITSSYEIMKAKRDSCREFVKLMKSLKLAK